MDIAIARRLAQLVHCPSIACKTPGKPRQAGVAYKADVTVALVDQMLRHLVAAFNIIGENNVVFQRLRRIDDIVTQNRERNSLMVEKLDEVA